MTVAARRERICLPNIGAQGRRRRLLGGALWGTAGAAAALVLSLSHSPRWAASLLVIPFTLAALGYFQARERT